MISIFVLHPIYFLFIFIIKWYSLFYSINTNYLALKYIKWMNKSLLERYIIFEGFLLDIFSFYIYLIIGILFTLFFSNISLISFSFKFNISLFLIFLFFFLLLPFWIISKELLLSIFLFCFLILFHYLNLH